ncbi:MAG: hypothetical protein FD137_207 [Spirochaetes bacterium]|nr:MAG: hypothetical protein FD137_207 [Spirochaetota bacterium]
MISLEEISKLDEPGAIERIYAYATDLKRHQKEIEEMKKALEVWKSRIGLAESKGLLDLAQGAKIQAAQIEAKCADLISAARELELDLEKLKEALPGIKARRRSVDPDALAAELAMMTGEALEPEKAKAERELDALEKKASSTGAEDALAALKRKMGL